MREHARRIYSAALAAVDPAGAVKNALSLSGGLLSIGPHSLNVRDYDQIVVVGAGKASAPMAQALEQVLGPLPGLVVVKDGHLAPTRSITLREASHPLPDARGVEAGRGIIGILKRAGAKTLVFNLLSGGGSALMVAPAPGINLADKQKTTSLLLAAGADIGQMNAVRKHLSRLKGGGLAQLARPALVVNLVISDVVGDRLDTIASGPCVPDSSTWREVADIFEKFKLWDKLPAAVVKRVNLGLAGRIADTPKKEGEFAHVLTHIVAGNRVALAAARAKAQELGYNVLVLTSLWEGDTTAAAIAHVAIAREISQAAQPLAPPACVLSGGETTVVLPDSHGLGGRNQEFALAALERLAGQPGILVLSLGTDGTDGPTNAAGALADAAGWHKAAELGLSIKDYLSRHDAYNFFAQTGGLIVTGPTNTNVMDLHLVLVAGAR